jgi:hypothetical protein
MQPKYLFMYIFLLGQLQVVYKIEITRIILLVHNLTK